MSLVKKGTLIQDGSQYVSQVQLTFVTSFSFMLTHFKCVNMKEKEVFCHQIKANIL